MTLQDKSLLAIYILILFINISISNGEYSLSISMKEVQKLRDFQKRMIPLLTKDYMKTDFYLIRWLRAKDFNVNAAQEMLKEDIKWRKENNIDTVHLEEIQNFEMEFPISVDTSDKKGRPVGTLDLSHASFRNVINTGRGHRLVLYFSVLMENVTKQVIEKQRNGFNVTQWRVVMNADGINMINHGCPLCIRIWLQLLSTMENHYPEWMYKFVIIEAPLTMHTIVDVARPFMSRVTRESLLVFGTDKSQWMKYLDMEIDRAERREIFGGVKP